jgi:uncharacterized protein
LSFDVTLLQHKYTDLIAAQCKTKYDNIIELLISEDTDADFDRVLEEENAVPILLAAVQGRHKEIIQLLMLQQNIDCNVKDRYGQTALIMAARKGYKDIVEILVKDNSVDLNARDNVSSFSTS